MLKVTYRCDLCRTEIALSEMGHAGAIGVNDRSVNYRHIDLVNFPPGWVKIGFSAICRDCFDLTIEAAEKDKPQ